LAGLAASGLAGCWAVPRRAVPLSAQLRRGSSARADQRVHVADLLLRPGVSHLGLDVRSFSS